MTQRKNPFVVWQPPHPEVVGNSFFLVRGFPGGLLWTSGSNSASSSTSTCLSSESVSTRQSKPAATGTCTVHDLPPDKSRNIFPDFVIFIVCRHSLGMMNLWHSTVSSQDDPNCLLAILSITQMMHNRISKRNAVNFTFWTGSKTPMSNSDTTLSSCLKVIFLNDTQNSRRKTNAKSPLSYGTFLPSRMSRQ